MRTVVFLDGKLDRRRGQVNALGGLVFLQDDKSKQNFLVDTGAAVSVLPHTEPVAPTGPPLAGTDGKTIPSWGSVTRTLSFGLRTFLCTFILAAVSKPILGTDFLAKHRLLVDPATGQVLDAETLSPLGSGNPTGAAAAKTPRSRLAASLCHIAPAVRNLIAQFPAVVGDGSEHQSQPMVFRTPLKHQADRFLQKREDWIWKNSASLSPNSENWNRQASFAGQIHRGHRRYTWYQNQMVHGDHAAIIAG